MKNLTLIVHAEAKQALADTLRNLVSDFSFTHIEGHGPQDETDPQLSIHDRVVGYTPHLRVDILLDDNAVDDVLQALRLADCGLSGRGSYWITAVEKYGKL